LSRAHHLQPDVHAEIGTNIVPRQPVHAWFLRKKVSPLVYGIHGSPDVHRYNFGGFRLKTLTPYPLKMEAAMPDFDGEELKVVFEEAGRMFW